MKKNLLKILSLLLAICTMVFCFSGCGFDYSADNAQTPPPHVCVYNKKISSEKYKSSDATCLKQAEYFYTCECGAKGSTKFVYGEKAEHSYKNDKCIWCGKEKVVSSTPTKPEEELSTIVYITPTGKRYHYSKSCAGKNASETTKTKAEKLGLTGCKKCT